jgi:hypothetical protein
MYSMIQKLFIFRSANIGRLNLHRNNDTKCETVRKIKNKQVAKLWRCDHVRGVIKNYGECCCRMRSNEKAGIFNTGSGASNLSNSV